jgi:hypothetical protein
LQQYDVGLQIAEQLLERGQKEGDNTIIRSGHLYIAINLVGLGQIEQAQAHMKEYVRRFTWIPTVNFWEGYYKNKFQSPADYERILDAMLKAGMRRF